MVGVTVEDAGADRGQMLVQELDFFIQDPGASGRCFGQRVGQLRQPVAPLGRLVEFPAEFLDLGDVPGPR